MSVGFQKDVIAVQDLLHHVVPVADEGGTGPLAGAGYAGAIGVQGQDEVGVRTAGLLAQEAVGAVVDDLRCGGAAQDDGGRLESGRGR